MALTPEELAQYRAKYGIPNTPASTSAPVQNDASTLEGRLERLRKAAAGEIETAPVTPIPIPEPPKKFGQKVEEFMNKPAFDMSTESRVLPTVGKTAANQVKSVAKLGYGVASFLNPIKNVKTIGQAVGATADAVNIFKEAKSSEKSADATTQKAIDTYKAKIAKGEDASRLGTFLKNMGVDVNAIQVPKSNLPSVGKELGNAALTTLTPAFIQKGIDVAKNTPSAELKANFGKDDFITRASEGFHAAVQSVAEDPQQLAPYFLGAKKTIETRLPKVDAFISKTSKTATSLPKTITKEIANLSGNSLKRLGYEGLGLPEYKTSLQTKYVQELAQTYEELFTGNKSSSKNLAKSKALGKDPATTLAENGYIVETAKVNGRRIVDSKPTITRIINEKVQPIEATLDLLFKAKDKVMAESDYFSLDKLAAEAKKRAKTSQVMGSGDLPNVYKSIDKTVADLKSTYGERVNYSQLNEIKKGQWQKVTTFDPTSPKYMGDVNRALGQQSRKMIEDGVSETNIGKINAEVGSWYDAIENLTKIDGNILKNGKIGSFTNRLIGTMLGIQAGGITGGVLGQITAGFITDLMQSTQITNPVKRAILEAIPPQHPVYDFAQRALNEIQYGQKALPSPQPGAPTYQSAVPINLPTKSGMTPYEKNSAIPQQKFRRGAPLFRANPKK